MQKILITLLILIPLLFTSASAPADTGPKATMTFEFVWELQPTPSITGGSLLQCEDETCAESQPLMLAGPQHFSCTASACESMAYGYAEYNRLQLEFSDGITRRSNIFTKNWFAASYRVTVRADDLLVEEQPGEVNPVVPFGILMALISALMVAIPALAMLGCTSLLIIGIVLLVRRSKRNSRAPPPAG